MLAEWLDGSNALYNATCEPDSTYGFLFTSTIDSMLSSRHLVYKYGTQAKTVYNYSQGQGQLLTEIDSTVYDGLGRKLLQQLLSYNAGSGTVNSGSRTFYYPHGNVVPNDCFGLIMNSTFDPIFCNFNGAFNQHDSIITYKLSPPDTSYYPIEKIGNIFSPTTDRVVETIFYKIGAMGWTPDIKYLHTYDAEGKVSQIDVFEKFGSSFMNTSTSTYTYNADNSLLSYAIFYMPGMVPFSKFEYGFDAQENIRTRTSLIWDGTVWDTIINNRLYLDTQGRLEATEYVNENGSSSRVEYVYIDNSLCPTYSNGYKNNGTPNWSFNFRTYYFPNFISDTEEKHASPEWALYPNPTSYGIWVEAPAGTPIQLADLQGRPLFRGIAEGKQFIPLPHVDNRQLVLTLWWGREAISRIVIVQQ